MKKETLPNAGAWCKSQNQPDNSDASKMMYIHTVHFSIIFITSLVIAVYL
jgi:hypothetical protein